MEFRLTSALYVFWQTLAIGKLSGEEKEGERKNSLRGKFFQI
jgi:hypothetical protein